MRTPATCWKMQRKTRPHSAEHWLKVYRNEKRAHGREPWGLLRAGGVLQLSSGSRHMDVSPLKKLIELSTFHLSTFLHVVLQWKYFLNQGRGYMRDIRSMWRQLPKHGGDNGTKPHKGVSSSYSTYKFSANKRILKFLRNTKQVSKQESPGNKHAMCMGGGG